MEKGRLQFLDAIRGIAALAVVLQHIFWFAGAGYAEFFSTVFSPGRFGVVTFFIVSGFIVPHSLEVRKDIKSFWISRFYRLYPAYWFSLLCFLVVWLLGIGQHPAWTPKFLVTWIVNLTMLQEFLKLQDINPVAWTLGLELVLYALITVAFARGILSRSMWIVYGLLGLMAVTSIAGPLVLHVRFPAGAAAVGASIVLGFALFRWFQGSLSKSHVVAAGLASFAVIVGSSLVNYLPTRSTTDPTQPTQLCAIVSAAAGILFFLAMLGIREVKFPGLILWFGRVSYSMYLMHPVAGQFIPESAPAYPRAFALLAMAILFSWIGYTFIEKPFIEIGRRAIAKRMESKAT